MVSRVSGRSLLVALAIGCLLALTVTVVATAGKGVRDERLAGAVRVETKVCKGSRVGARQLRRLCRRARAAGPLPKRGPDRGRPAAEATPAPAPAPVPVAAPSGPTPAPAAPAPLATAPGVGSPQTPQPPGGGSPPAEPQAPGAPTEPAPPEPAPATPEPKPEPKPEPEPEPEPAPATPEPKPEPEPEPEPEPAPEPKPEPGPEPAPAPSVPTAAEPPPALSPVPRSIYWGAWIGDHLTGSEAPWDMGAVAAFERLAGKGVSLVNFSAPFANCSASPCRYYEFPAAELTAIRAHGAIPVYSWGSQSIPAPASLHQPDFQLADVIAGAHDAYLRRFAEAARDWGHPFFIRFNWEMNGGWFAWAEGANGNGAGEYVAAWRHVHDIFAEVGATNATWVWCPNVDPDGAFQDLAPLYPGDAYVDWTGLDGYNWGTNPARPDRWRSFDSLFRSTYDEIAKTIAPAKPMLIGEIGSTEHGGSKAAWIADMLARVPVDYPQIHGLLWFEKYDDGMDWPLATSGSAAETFAAGIANGAYAENRFGAISTPAPR